MEHEYLPPAMSFAAVARAKDEFEKLQQKTEDSLTEHVNEFRRRLENLIKIRGPDGGSPYADFDLRDLLLRSLYKPLWGSWIASRRSNANLPTTFENLVLALKQAESDMILEGPSIFESFMPSAHITKTSPKDFSSSSPITNSKCQTCGSPFTPKRATHLRCDPCQADFAAKRKSDRKKLKTSSPRAQPRKSTPSKSKVKHAHSTVIDPEYEDSDSSDDDNMDTAAYANFTSFFCTHATSFSTSDEPHVYFDNCSNLNIIRDRALALNLRTEPIVTNITGSIPGRLTANQSAELGDLGRGCFNPNFSRNLISEDAALKSGYRIIRDSATTSSYQLLKDKRPPLIFSANPEGTFSLPLSRFLAHFNDLYVSSHSTDVNRSDIIFTKRQRERAAIYHHDHQHSLGHCHHDRIIAALRGGLLMNVPYTEADVRNAQVIYGPCPQCTRTKGTRHHHIGTYPNLPSTPGEYLAGDLFTIMGILFSLITCRLVKLRCVTRLSNKGASEITRAIRETVNVWKGYGAQPRVLSWDQEPALVHSSSEIWTQHGLRLEFVPPDSHERVAERDVRTLKEHVYATILGLNHAVDEEMVEGIVRDTVGLLNFLPNSETPGATPRTILDGERLNYARWSRVYAGQVAEFEIPYVELHKRGTRKEIGYVIGHQGDNPIVRLLPHGKRLVIRSGHIRPLAKSPAIIALIERGITGAKRQRYNDLLAEINDFNGSLHPNFLDSASPLLDSPTPDSDPTVFSPPVVPPPTPSPPLAPPASIFPSTDDELTFLAQPPDQSSLSSPPTTVPPDSPSPSTDTELTFLAQPSEHPPPLPSLPDDVSHPPPTPTVAPALPSPLPRRTTRSGASKPPGYYKKLASGHRVSARPQNLLSRRTYYAKLSPAGESVSDYTACHLRATDSERLYGKELTRGAGVTEVHNMIMARKAALPRDYRKLSTRTIREALPSFMFYKAKDETPEPLPDLTNNAHQVVHGWTTVLSKKHRKNPQRKIRLRGRWVGGGHRQRKCQLLKERNAPTARSATHSLLLAIASMEGRRLHVGDIPSAYLQADHKPADGRPVHIIADKHTTRLIIETLPQYKDFAMPDGRMILLVNKAMYGLVESAWLWYKELEKHLLSIGYTVSTSDRALFYKKTFKDGVCIASNIASVHVDDIASAASPNAEGLRLEQEFWNSMELKWPGIKRQSGPHYRHLSWNIYQDPTTMKIHKSQRDYILELVKATGVHKEHNLPCRANLLSSDLDSTPLPDAGISTYRSTLQKVAYAREGRPDIDFAVSFLQSKQAAPTHEDWSDLAHLLGYLKRHPDRPIHFAPSNLQLHGFADAAFNITPDGRSHYGYIVRLGGSLISTKGGRIKSVVRSSTEAEISAVNELLSDLLWYLHYHYPYTIVAHIVHMTY